MKKTILKAIVIAGHFITIMLICKPAFSQYIGQYQMELTNRSKVAAKAQGFNLQDECRYSTSTQPIKIKPNQLK